jgi:hypothetical protein
MIEQLREKVAALRAVAPELNAATDEAGQAVQAVDKLLEDLGLGVSQQSGWFDEEFGEGDEVRRFCLAYGRCAGRYRLHVLTVTFRKQDDEVGEQAEAEERMPWSSCPREVKLRAFAMLPELLNALAEEAARLAEQAKATTQQVQNILEVIDATVGDGGTLSTAPMPDAVHDQPGIASAVNPDDGVGELELDTGSDRIIYYKRLKHRLRIFSYKTCRIETMDGSRSFTAPTNQLFHDAEGTRRITRETALARR